MSRIVLGTSRISRLDQKGANRIFDQAKRLGISIFDTAPSYGDSELKISLWKKQADPNSHIRITTKFGIHELSSTQTLSRALVRIQNLYKPEDIQTIFIHSIPLSQIGQKVFDELISFRDAGEISRIGYSGDGGDLKQAIQTGCFDAVMCTLNPIDNRNIEVLIESNCNIDVYAKRVMANYAWTLKNQIRRNVLRRNNWVIAEYKSRLEKYMAFTPRNKLASEFVNYALTSSYADYSVFGISSVTHLNKLFKSIEKKDNVSRSNYPIVPEESIT